MKLKRILAVVLVVVMIAMSLISCAKSEKDEGTATQATTRSAETTKADETEEETDATTESAEEVTEDDTTDYESTDSDVNEDTYTNAEGDVTETDETENDVTFSSLMVGNHVKFGSCVQSDENAAYEEIEWRIIAEEDGKYLLISEYALSLGQYKDYKGESWDNSIIKKQLDLFYEQAFSSAEKAKIVETTRNADNNTVSQKVFLLSSEEADIYFKNDEDRLCGVTGLCAEQMVNSGYYDENSDVDAVDEMIAWWLSDSIDNEEARFVTGEGFIPEHGRSVTDECGFRPAIWIEP